MKVDTTELLKVSSFAEQYGQLHRQKSYSRRAIELWIKGGKFKTNHVIDIDGILFLHKKALETK